MNKNNAPKIKYMFGDEEKEDSILGLSFIKNLLTISGKSEDKQIDYNAIKMMKDLLYSFSTTTAGISNALIFLDERKNVINNLDYYNYNPWKADWIYSKEYKEERKDLIHK